MIANLSLRGFLSLAVNLIGGVGIFGIVLLSVAAGNEDRSVFIGSPPSSITILAPPFPILDVVSISLILKLTLRGMTHRQIHDIGHVLAAHRWSGCLALRTQTQSAVDSFDFAASKQSIDHSWTSSIFSAFCTKTQLSIMAMKQDVEGSNRRQFSTGKVRRARQGIDNIITVGLRLACS